MKILWIDPLGRRKGRAAPVPEDAPWWLALDAGMIRAAVAQLPDELRETFDRFVLRGQSYSDIAAAQRIPKTTVGTRILRARRRIKLILTEKRASR